MSQEPVDLPGAKVVLKQPAQTDQSANQNQAEPTSSSAEKANKGKVETEAERQAREREERLKSLIPDPKKNRPIDHGISLADGHRKRDEPIDMGGRYSLEEALRDRLEFGNQIDLDWELYDRLTGPMEYFYTKRMEAQAAGKADFEDIAKLPPAIQAALEDYTVWRERADQIRELRKSKDRKEREIGIQARIFSEGLEYQRGLLALEQMELIATHALGYELTNGGTEALSFGLRNHLIDFSEKASIPAQLRQAIHEIAEASHFSDPVDRARIVGAALVAAGTGIEVGKIVTVISGNPLLGAAVGAGSGIAVLGSEIVIGNWILSFPPASQGERVSFKLRFIANPPANSPQSRIVDSPLGKHFSGRGEGRHDYTGNFIVKSEKTRHAIYRRLGLRVENYRNFNWNTITPAQERFIRNLGIRRPLIGGWNALDNTTKDNIRNQARQAGTDLWMIDLNPTNLTIGGTDTASFHGRVRQHIQNILTESYRNLPQTALSSGEIYYNLSQLSANERHEIMVEAYNRMATDICSTAGGNVLQRIMLREEGRAGALDQLQEDATAIKTGDKVVEETEITDEVIQSEQRRRAQAKDRVNTIQQQGELITTLDTQISTKKTEAETAESEFNRISTEQGSLGDSTASPSIGPTGNIREYTEKISEFNQKIAGFDHELGIDGFNPSNNTYPLDSLFGKRINLTAEVSNLETEVEVSQAQLSGAQQTRNTGEITRISGELRGKKTSLTAKQRELSAVEQRINTLNTQKESLNKEKLGFENQVKESLLLVQEAKEKRDARNRELTGLTTRRQAAIEEIRRLTNFQGDYGSTLYQTLLSQANAEVAKIEKELKERGIPFEAGEEVKIASEVDKRRGEGMDTIYTVGNNLKTILESIWKKYDAAGLSDPKICKETLIRIIFGEDALSPDKRAYYETLLSNSLIIEELFDTVHAEGRENQFFYGDNEGRLAYDTSRRNQETIGTLSAQIEKLENAQETGWENQKRILEERLHHLQDENVRLLDGLFVKYVPAFLGHSRFTDGEFVRKLVDRMVKNANDFEPFAGTVRYGEKLTPHLGLDGSVIIRPPDINPTDGSLINRGEVSWHSPDSYRVAGQFVNLRIETPVSNTGRPRVNVEFQVQDIRGLHAVLPSTLAQLPPSSPIATELNRLGLLNQLYDATTGNKVSNRTNAFRTLAADENSNRQISETVWRISTKGITNANHLEAWLRGGANYNFGESDRFYRSLARSFAESTPEANIDVVRGFNAVRQATHEIRYDRGELRLYRYNAAVTAVETSVSLHDLLYGLDVSQRLRIISDRDLNGILYEVGKNLFESARLRRA